MTPDFRLVGILTEKDRNSVITHCNESFPKYAGLKSIDDIIGRTDEDFPWQEYSPIYRMHELDALSGNNYSAIIPFKDYTGNNLIFLHTKLQKRDTNQKIVGVSCRAIEIINPDVSALVNLLCKQAPEKTKIFKIEKHSAPFHLSQRQSEILFFLVRGKSNKAIANIMGLSPRTIEYYLDILKAKFKCHSKYELTDLAIKYGFLETIPVKHTAHALVKKLKAE